MKFFWQKILEQKKRKTIIFVVFFSFFISLVYSGIYQIEPSVDAKAYDRIAQNLVIGNGFREDATVSVEFDNAMLRAGPGYEFFLAGIYWVFGHHYEMVWIFQALLHGATAWLVYLAARALWPEKKEYLALFAAAIIGFHPDLIEISAMVMTETLYLFFTAALLFLFARLNTIPSLSRAIGLGAVLGLGFLTRPPLLIFLPIFIVYFSAQKRWKEAGLVTIAAVLILTPWTIRNYKHFQMFIPTTMVSDFNIWVGNLPSSDGGQLASGFNPVTTYRTEYGLKGLPNAAQESFKNFVLGHPGGFTKLTLIRVVYYASLIRPMGFWFYQTGWSQLLFVVSSGLAITVLFVLGLSGLLLSLWEKYPKKWYLLVLTLSAPAPLILTVVESRYRFQIYPFLAVYAGFALWAYLEKNPLAKKMLLTSLVILVGFSLIDLFISWEEVTGHLGLFH